MEPSPQELKVAVQLARQMLDTQRRFFRAMHGTTEKRKALDLSRQLEDRFDKMTRDWFE
jgi:hypothetical protein